MVSMIGNSWLKNVIIGTLLVCEPWDVSLTNFCDTITCQQMEEKKDKLHRIIASVYTEQDKPIPKQESQLKSESDSDENERVKNDDTDDVSSTSDSDSEDQQAVEAERVTPSGRLSRRKTLDDFVY